MTFVSYPDFQVDSPGGRIRLEATSPENAEEAKPYRFFQSNFIYRARDIATGDLVWERRQGEREHSPRLAWISDSGWCVVATSDADLYVIDSDGRLTAVVELHDLLKNDGRDDLQWSTAGSHWYWGSFIYFPADDVWACRLPSSWRIVLNLSTGECHCEAGVPGDALLTYERDWSVCRLRRAASEIEKLGVDDEDDEDRRANVGEVILAVHLAGQLNATDAVESLRCLELCRELGSCLYAPEVGPEVAVALHTIRRDSQWALRCFGVEPQGYSPYRFWRLPSVPDPTEIRIRFDESRSLDVPERIADRAKRADAVHLGLSAGDVLALLGAPDKRIWDKQWVYHFAEPAPHSFRITFGDHPGIVTSLDREPDLQFANNLNGFSL
jgi:hypothetical protein